MPKRTQGVTDEEERVRILAALEDACEAIETYVDEAFGPAEPIHA